MALGVTDFESMTPNQTGKRGGRNNGFIADHSPYEFMDFDLGYVGFEKA